jgi:hypothetical protein
MNDLGNFEDGQAVGDDEQLDPREKVVRMLSAKILKLSQAIFALSARQGRTPIETIHIELQLAAATNEVELCEARRDAIGGSEPFNDPGPDAEDALLAAMNRVDASTAATAATSALLLAVHGLVQAYSSATT